MYPVSQSRDRNSDLHPGSLTVGLRLLTVQNASCKIRIRNPQWCEQASDLLLEKNEGSLERVSSLAPLKSSVTEGCPTVDGHAMHSPVTLAADPHILSHQLHCPHFGGPWTLWPLWSRLARPERRGVHIVWTCTQGCWHWSRAGEVAPELSVSEDMGPTGHLPLRICRQGAWTKFLLYVAAERS